MAITFLVPSHRLKRELSGDIHYSKFVFFERPLLHCLGVCANEALIRNLPLTLENAAESAAKAIASQQKSLDSLVEVVLDNRIDSDYLLAEKKRHLCWGQHH